MADMKTQLRSIFSARTLLKAAPLWALAGGAGAIIGAAIGDPHWSQTGLGMVLASLSTNLSSSLLYELITPDLADERREELIARGLAQRDPAVIRLVAEALTQAGPELARAIPDATRAQLVDLLERGMRESGGALATIAPVYAAALRSPPADWRAFQAQLQQTLRKVSQTMETSEGGVISGSRQTAPQIGGSIEQIIRAHGKGSSITDSDQIVTGGAGTSSHRCPDCGVSVPAGQRVCGSCGARVPA